MASRKENLNTAIDALAAELGALTSTKDMVRAGKIADLIKKLKELAAAEDHPVEIESRETT